MSKQSKPKFKKVKLKPSLTYREIEADCKKKVPNARIAKLDQIEKEGIEKILQVEWECKINTLRSKHGVNYCLVKIMTYNYYD